jgi:UPF0271 protein
MRIDLNADLGEGAGFDAALMPLVTSANVCCGRHAGGPEEMRATVERAKRHGVAIGAHPGYDDRSNFGRRELNLPRSELIGLIRSQIADLVAAGADVKYVKPHGALYNQACRDAAIADAVVEAVGGLPIVGLPGSELSRGAAFIAEGFADRRYRPDGSLVPRTEPDAFVHDPAEAVKQVHRLIRDRGIRTICVHGDNPDAVAFATAVRIALLEQGFELRAFA